MGDEERSTEAEQEGEEKETKMVLQCPPIYPLPEEIKKMERSETVCRYCGVSYLIFHEFHQLHTRLAQLEEELQGLRETTQREKAQREALELGRLEWEKAFRLEVQRQTEEKEKSTREELEERRKESKEAERALREEFEQKYEMERQKIKDEQQKISEERERQLRRELGELQTETLREQREELERRAEEREKVLSDALQKANKNLGELRKYLQQLEERLAKAGHTKEEAEQSLEKEMRQGEILRGACVRQQQALRATLSVLRSSGSELTDVRGFLSQLTGVWQAFRSQILQHSTQVFSVLREELKHSSTELQKLREENERLTQQLMEQRRQSEEKLSQQKDSENQHRGKLLRLKEELEEKQERWLSCQRKCDIMQEQLSSCCAAEEEVTRLGQALEKVQQETRELRRKREILIESHGRALTKMEEDCRQQMSSTLAAALEEQITQNALHLREQMEEFRREVELELTIDREKNQLLLLQYQRDSTQLQEKLEERERVLRGLQDELQEERGSRVEEERRRRRRSEEEIRQELQRSQQQEALQLSQARGELQLVTERNAELQEEAALLQETVRRECEEREELTAALSQAQGELLGLRSLASHQGSSRSPPNPIKRQPPPGNKHFHLHSQTRVTLTRSLNSPNTLRPSPPLTDKDRGQGTDGGGAGRGFESWNQDEKRREGTLPRLKASSTVSEVKRKVSLAMGRKERLQKAVR